MEMDFTINKILAEEIQDSRGNPTIKVTVWAGSFSASFSVPSGASTGIHEAHELRDPDGLGVKNAIAKVNGIIAPALLGTDASKQEEIDKKMIELDGTPNKDNLGANGILGVSIACAKVAAKVAGIEVFEYLRTLQVDGDAAQTAIKPSRNAPYLFMNLIEGGKHADNGLAFQEYHIVPDTENISDAINVGVQVQDTLKEIILRDLDKESIVLGDEGGFAPKVTDVRKPLQYLREALKQNNLSEKVRLALDVAASAFFEGTSYKVAGENISKMELANIYKSLIQEFNLFSIEDPFNEEDFESYCKLKSENQGLLVVGDDLTVSNQVLLKKAISNGSINAMIIKPNQIGTLTETLKTMKLARENDIELIVSHRSGETDDDFIADLAFAFNCFGLKSGSPQKAERMVKYERLKKIINLK